MNGTHPHLSLELVDHRLNAIERAVEKISDAVAEIASNTTALARLEVQHHETREAVERAFKEVRSLKAEDADLDKRVRSVELELPGFRDTRSLIDRAMLGIVAAVGMAVLSLVLHS